MDNVTEQATSARMNQAKETLKEAEVLFEQDFWRGTINRSYYAMFNAVLALAASRGVAISKHTHAIAFLDKEFVKSVRSFRSLVTFRSTAVSWPLHNYL